MSSAAETGTPLRAVVFDRDGVLTDFDLAAGERFFGPRVPLSLWEISDRWEQWGNQVGFPRSLAEEEAFFHGLWDSLCDELNLSDTVRDDLHAFDYSSCLHVFPDVLPALQAARGAGLRVGVLSNFGLASLDRSLAATGLSEWIDVACAATVIGASKPVPAAYAAVLERLGVEASACLFFDDEPECVEGARAVGMDAYLVDRRRERHDPAAKVAADLSLLHDLLVKRHPASCPDSA